MAPVLTQNPMSTHEFSYSNDDKLTALQNFTGVKSMNKDMEVFGVQLADDRYVGRNADPTDNRYIVLGTVCLGSTAITLDELRRVMCTELPCLPASFHFLSKERWPINKLQETKLKANHVIKDNKSICIRKEFEKSRIGVTTSTGEPVGFIFTDLNVNLKQLRDVMEQQLKISQQMRLDYRFVERNGWPVMPTQELVLSLIDIMLNQVICIHNLDRHIPDSILNRPTSLIPSNIYPPLMDSSPQLPSLPSPSSELLSVEHKPVRRIKSLKFISRQETQTSIKIRKDSEKRHNRISKESFNKPILISYVRAEAAQYALDLKQVLVSMGFSVYLDVHEIKTGSDWQDALNLAVTHCFLFVPLITTMYGKTQWTNREIKLADVLGKKIIPVNFLESWPPACLAIQFASTQYIPWKLHENEHIKGEPEKSSDHRVWDQVYLKNVASKIAECYKDIYCKVQKKEIIPQASKPLLSPREDYYILSKDESTEDSKKIVISAHPRQKYLAQDLKSMFEKDGHEVWCSVDLFELHGNLLSEETSVDPNTPRNLPTIQEGDVFFSQTDEVFSSIGDKKSFSITKEPEAFGRRPLSRLMSQFSDISHPSTLSQEKLDHLRTFQQKVDQAAVVIVLVSEAYTKSTFSHQQVFYCEHRKRVVLVKCDVAPVPKWFRLLMGNDMILKVNNPQFECGLQGRVKRALNPSSSETPKDATSEAKMNYLVNFLKRNLALQDICVYVTGSSKLQSPRAEEICRAIGAELAKVENVSIVTGGFYGAAEITATTFHECRENNATCSKEESSVVHILPMHDTEDLTAKARQNPDGSFEAIPFGKTFFLGDSVKERETVVARLVDTCIVIEGGPGVVHEVEEFIWNDHFVIPIMSTGGAAGGLYGVPVKIFELPPGVDAADWSVLSEKEASAEAVAKAVVNIIVSLKKAVASPINTLKSKAILKRKSRKKLKSRRFRLQDLENMQDSSVTPTPPLDNSMHDVFGMRAPSETSQSTGDGPRLVIKRKYSWWRRFLNVIKHKN